MRIDTFAAHEMPTADVLLALDLALGEHDTVLTLLELGAPTRCVPRRSPHETARLVARDLDVLHAELSRLLAGADDDLAMRTAIRLVRVVDLRERAEKLLQGVTNV